MDGSTLLAMSDFLDPRSGPDQSGEFRVSPGFYVGLCVLGFVVGGIGHLVRSKALIAAGIAMVFVATVALPVAVAVSN